MSETSEDPHYRCRVDGEDLTEKVREERERGTVRVFKVLYWRPTGTPERATSQPWRVMVTCSKGHENVFSGES